ncbi:pentapeptide repeat-containing protein [Actinosynnema sp. CS-041913]|uniref:pentapeptide repeat-containing protein n=1 Tax=Actinosynnema sp. CS-041913 TaxID=3239917 RepID=UPI003D8CFF18
MAESSGTREPWRPLRWPTSPDAARALTDWLAGDPEDSFFAVDLDLRGADLSGGPFVESWFSRANLADTTLRGTEFWAAHCEETRFIRATLTDADFVKAHLHGASFVRAVLIAADFTRAEGLNARFVDADLRRAELGHAIFPDSDFTRANLSGAHVNATSFRDGTLVDAVVAGMSGSVIGPVEVAPGVRLGGAELEQWFAARSAEVSVLRTESV